MTHDNIPEDDDVGGNFAVSEKTLAQEARVVMSAAEKLFVKQDAMLVAVHAAIIAVGEKLQVGRDLYEADNNAFAHWVSHYRLDQGKVFGGDRGRQQRTAAMTIFRLVTIGAETGEDGAVPRKLDLTDCKRGRPDDIVSWARQKQPWLFHDLRIKMAAAKKPKQPSINERLSASADGISTNLREENAKLRAEVARLKALLAKHGIASELNDAMPLLEAEANNPEEKKAPAKKAAKAKRKTEPLKAGESPIVEGSDLSRLLKGLLR